MSKGWCLIPASVFSDTKLSDSEKMLFGKLLGLTNKTGYCWASDRYLASLFDVSERSIQRRLNSLKKRGYIEIEQNGRRYIRVVLEGDRIVDEGTTDLAGLTTSEDLKRDNSRNKLYEDMLCKSVHQFWGETRADRMLERGLLKRRRIPPLSTERRKAILNARKGGYTEEDMKEAILAVLSRDYHLDNGFTDLTLILRDTKIEQYLAWSVQDKQTTKREEIKELVI